MCDFNDQFNFVLTLTLDVSTILTLGGFIVYNFNII